MQSLQDNIETPTIAADTDQYAKVEIMGHDVMYGRVQEVPFLGTSMLRVETMPLPEEPETVVREESRYTTCYVEDDQPCEDDDLWAPPRQTVQREVKGRYIRPAVPAQPSEVRVLGANAIFSVTFISRDECLAQSLLRRVRMPAKFVPNVETVPQIAAMPANGGDSNA